MTALAHGDDRAALVALLWRRWVPDEDQLLRQLMPQQQLSWPNSQQLRLKRGSVSCVVLPCVRLRFAMHVRTRRARVEGAT
jgi:hypothetical protein